MRQFSELEIQAADILLKFGGNKFIKITHWLQFPNYSDFPEAIIHSMAHQLESDGLISLKNDGDDIMYMVKPNANPYQFPPETGYNQFLQEETQKKARLDEKEELTLQDLRKKPELNAWQLFVLKGTTPRHYQTLMMVLIGVLVTAVMAMLIKSCIP